MIISKIMWKMAELMTEFAIKGCLGMLPEALMFLWQAQKLSGATVPYFPKNKSGTCGNASHCANLLYVLPSFCATFIPFLVPETIL